VLAVVNAQMARALRHISTERGRDPKEYTLVAFGGAGGLHACALADAMQMQKVLIPRYPGAFSALGLALADVRRETIRSFFAPLTESETPRLRETFSAMVENVQAKIRAEGVDASCLQAEAFLEAQYVGQSYALRVPFRPRSRTPLMQAERAFHRAHRLRYGYADPVLPVEIVAVGVLGVGRNEVNDRLLAPSLPASPGTPCAVVSVIERGETLSCPCWRREELALGQTLIGPAVILQDDSTTYLAVGWRASVDAAANLLLTSRSTV
jgi:N-methylhydantoinase A